MDFALELIKIRRRSLALLLGLPALSLLASMVGIGLKGLIVKALETRSYGLPVMVPLILAFLGLQLFMIAVNILSSYLGEVNGVGVVQKAWEKLYPKDITQHTKDLGERFYQLTIEQVPQLFNLRIKLKILSLQILVIVVSVGANAIHDQFYLGLLFIPVLTGLTFVANLYKGKDLQANMEVIAHNQIYIMRWIKRFFASAREREHNWSSPEQAQNIRQWYQYQSVKLSGDYLRLIRTSLQRSLLQSLLNDGPYALCMAAILLYAAFGQLTIAQLVVWMSLLGMLIQAGVSLSSIHVTRLETRTIKKLLDENLGLIRRIRSLLGASIPDSTQEPLRFVLRDGSSTELHSKAGIYHIKGDNGSGKSTLINTLIGFNHEFDGWDPMPLANLQQHFTTKVRVIEKEPVIFEDIADFRAQIMGPAGNNASTLKDLLGPQMAQVLSAVTQDWWLERICKLEIAWIQRHSEGASVLLSDGEKVVLSVARVFSSWNPELRLLVSDEGDACLDATARHYYWQMLHELAAHVCVYCTSHQGEQA